MPTHNQGTVESPVTDNGLGKSSTNSLKDIYADSPIHKGELTAESIKQSFQDDTLDAVINDAGHTFGTFDTGYIDAPDLEDVETGAGGLPASPYVPNPSSPGEGSVNATDQPEAPDGYGQTPNSQWGSGVGSALQPKVSSAKISGQKLGDYVMGSSKGE